MKEKIINCYELDIKQDIPVEMEMLKSSNENLNNSNRVLRITLLSIGIVIIFFAVYQNSKTKKENEDKF